MPKSAHKVAYDSMLRRCRRAIESKCAESIYQILDGDTFADTPKLSAFPTLDEKYRPQLMAILDAMVPTGPEPAVKVDKVTKSEDPPRGPKSPNGNPFDTLYRRQHSDN